MKTSKIKYFAYRMKLRKSFRELNTQLWDILVDEFHREERKRQQK